MFDNYEYNNNYLINVLKELYIEKDNIDIMRYNSDPSFLEYGINNFIIKNKNINTILNNYLQNNKHTISIISILEHIIINKIISKRTENFHIIYKLFSKRYIINNLFENTIYSKKIKLELQNMLMTRNYYTDNRYILNKILLSILKYISGPIESLRVCKKYNHMIGHFIESIIIKRNNLDLFSALKSNRTFNKNTNTWTYTENDYEKLIYQISKFTYSLKLKNHEFDNYFKSIIPHSYIDQHLKNNMSIDILKNDLLKFYLLIEINFNNFQLYTRTLRAVIYTILSLNKLNLENKLKFQGSITYLSPLMYEIDMLTSDMIVELKTGHSDVKKNMKKMLLESMLPTINQSNFVIKRDIILINIRSLYVHYIKTNK